MLTTPTQLDHLALSWCLLLPPQEHLRLFWCENGHKLLTLRAGGNFSGQYLAQDATDDEPRMLDDTS